MDLPLDDSSTKRRIIQEEYKKHHSDKHSRFVQNASVVQQKDWQVNQQLFHRLKNQPANKKPPKQFNEMHNKQTPNATPEQQNTSKLNGGFNNNDIIQVRKII